MRAPSMSKVWFVVPWLLAGCVSFGGDRGPEIARKVVELQDGSFRIVASDVRGEAICRTSMFINIDFGWILSGKSSGPGGFGISFDDPALRSRAMADLHANYRMQGPQVLVNVVEEFSTSGFLFFYREVKLTITADVLEFLDDA